MQVKIVSRDEIPKRYYLCKPSTEDWKFINKIKFTNGLKYYIGSNYEIKDLEGIKENLKSDYESYSEYDTAPELQKYFYQQFDTFIEYNDCVKIFNYYKINKKKILQIINDL